MDLAELAKTDPSAAARIVTLIEEISGDELTDDHFSDDERGIEVLWLREVARSERLNIWRLKLFSLSSKDTWIKQRPIYAVDSKSQEIWFLAVMPREEDYEGPRFARVRKEYINLYISLLPG